MRKIVFTLVLAICLSIIIAVSVIPSTFSELNVFSNRHKAVAEMGEVKVLLLENDALLSDGEIPLLDIGIDANQIVGRTVDEEVSVFNAGSVDSFVRVSVFRYWVDNSGEKQINLDPNLLELTFEPGWIEDYSSQTAERRVFYYPYSLSAGYNTSPLITSVSLCKDAMSPEYNEMFIVFDIKVDAVQASSGADAIKNCWGIDASVVNGGLTIW